jgi:hypothetical protein
MREAAKKGRISILATVSVFGRLVTTFRFPIMNDVRKKKVFLRPAIKIKKADEYSVSVSLMKIEPPVNEGRGLD